MFTSTDFVEVALLLPIPCTIRKFNFSWNINFLEKLLVMWQNSEHESRGVLASVVLPKRSTTFTIAVDIKT